MKIKKTLPLLAVLAFSMLTLSSNDEVFGLVESSPVQNTEIEIVSTIPTETEGTYQHFIKICAGENDRLERPNIIITSDLESFREQVYINLPPNFCTYQNFAEYAKFCSKMRNCSCPIYWTPLRPL